MQNTIYMFFGRKGSGKSFLARQRSKDIPRLVIADTMDEYLGGHIFDNLDDFKAKFPELWGRENFRAICKFTHDEEYNELFDYCFQYRNYTLLIDETDKFAGANFIIPEVKRLISYGRHRQIDLILIARRPYEVHVLCRSQADHVLTFIQTEPRDLEYLAQMGFNPADVEQLGKYKYIEIDNRK